LDANGIRFANKLGRRDYVTGETWKNKPPFRLVLNKAASDEIVWHCEHYTGHGVVKFFECGAALAQDMGAPMSVWGQTREEHYQSAKKTEEDPEGGALPAYPFGKSWDEARGRTGLGKKFYHYIFPGSEVRSEPVYVAIITPVIRYCLGGLGDRGGLCRDGQERKGHPWPACCRRGCRRRPRQQPPWWQLTVRLCRLRPCCRRGGRQVQVGCGR